MMIYKKIMKRLYHVFRRVMVMFELVCKRGDAIFLFGCPVHSNLGDQAQTYCIDKWLRLNYPKHKIYHFNWSTSYPLALGLLTRRIKRNDLVFFHSGYLMVDHHRELPVMCEVIRRFSDHRIVVFPQTINLKSKAVREEVIASINSHPDLFLLCRDEVSYASAQVMFERCRLLLYPDVVTSLIGSRTFGSNRNGVLFCMRNDVEAHYKPSQIGELSSRLEQHARIGLTDTSVAISRYFMERNREALIGSALEEFSKYKVIITDRYHGTIFSLITGTPVIVLSSADHKLSSGVKWFPESYRNHVAYAENLDEAYNLAIMFLERKLDYQLPAYFQQEYYDGLADKLVSN